ncbi:MAG: GNAT family N-acetyltransferase [Actinomycetaceae bacterium]|nr:GNAT family N-acetyltransferase [Actinomycetaceae bacterium]
MPDSQETQETDLTRLQVLRLSRCNETQQEQVTELFVDAYYKEMSNFSRDRQALIRAFSSALDPSRLFVLLEDSEPVAMLGYATAKHRVLHPSEDAFIREFGVIRGGIGYKIFSYEYCRTLPIEAAAIYLECLATAPQARGKGYAKRLMNWVMDTIPAETIYLDVNSSNQAAIHVHKSLGFQEIKRRFDPIGMMFMGYTHLLIMRRRGTKATTGTAQR